MESLNSRSVLPHGPPYGSNWGHKIADLEFLPYISFIVAFIASESIKRYWESICGESKLPVSFTPRPPLMGQTGVINSCFGVFALYLLYRCFYSFRMY